MAVGQQHRTTAASILQIDISRNTNCAIKDGFRRDSHNYAYNKIITYLHEALEMQYTKKAL